MALTWSQGLTAGDPKFWPATIRYLVLANLSFFVFLGNAYSAGIATGFEELAEEFHTDFTMLTELISWSVFTQGISNLFWMPTAMCLGKRPVMIISMLMMLAGTIWSSQAQSINGLLGSRVLASFGSGSIESLGPSIIADVFFERYFSTANALFAICLAMGTQFGPVIAGYLIEARGWRWYFILIAILTGINILTVLFFLPETTYRRVVVEGETAAETDKEAQEMVAHIEKNDLSRTDTQPDGIHRHHYSGYWKDLVQFRGRSYEPSTSSAWIRQFSLPFRFLLVPAVLFASCAYGLMLAGIVVISAISPEILSPPPYLFTSIGLGLSNLASFVGVLLAYPIAGPLTDSLSQYMRRRNRGVHQPEHRMPALLFAFFIAPPGLILFSYMISEGRSFYLAAIGYAMQSAGLVLVPSVVISYAVDAYPSTGGEALVLINCGKNLVAFGITNVSAGWLATQGLTNMFLELAGAQWGVLALALPLYFAGPWLRRATLSLL